MVRGNPSQERTLDPEGAKATLNSMLIKYGEKKDTSLERKIINLMQICIDNDINIAREARIFNKIKSQNG